MTKEDTNKSLVLIILLIGFVSLASSQSNSQKADRISEPFFPPHAFDAKLDLNSFVVDWYSKHLAALQEPSLWGISKSSKQEIYRFLWLRTFHVPVAIRLNIKSDGTGALTIKTCSGAGGYEPGKLIRNEAREVSSVEIKSFLDLIDEQKYWELPTKEEDPSTAGEDGAKWIIEAVRNGKYKIVDRWSPDKGPIRSLGLRMLLDLSKLKLPIEEIY